MIKDRTDPDQSTKKANPEMISMWAKRDKCFMCKYKLEQPVLLPVNQVEHGKFQPNINTQLLWHVKDTHGIPPETTREWIIGSVYGMELGLFGIKGVNHDGIE